MSFSCFVKELATTKLITDVASFCSSCYKEINIDEFVYYDMRNCCYLCDSCQKKYRDNSNENGEDIITSSFQFS